MATFTADEAALADAARDHYVDRTITRGEYLAARQGLEARIEATRRRLIRTHQNEQAAHVLDGAANLADRWAELPVDRRRAVLAAVIDHIVIQPARVRGGRFDPDRIEIAWQV